MNKTLLLIICDFLLISILALVEFRPEFTEISPEEELLSQSDADLIEVLQLALESEDARNRELAEQLGITEQELQQRLEDLEETERRRSELAEDLEATAVDLDRARDQLEMTEAQRRELSEDLSIQQQEANRLQRELREKLSALSSAEQELNALEEARADWQNRERQLETNLQIRETEKAMLEQNLIAAQAEVERARVESERAQQRAEQLASEVGVLADRSTEIREEIRQAQPMSLNAIFRRFEDNRATLSFRYRQSAVLGTRERIEQAQTIIVEQDGALFALFESSIAGLRADQRDRLQSLEARITLGGRTLEITELSFLAEDPAVVVVAIPPEEVERTGMEPFQLTVNPLQFPDAVLVHGARDAYGELPVRTMPGRPDYLSVESRSLSRLTGDFTPSRGDFVFSKSGDLLGIMVEPAAARIIRTLETSAHLPIGEQFSRENLRWMP